MEQMDKRTGKVSRCISGRKEDKACLLRLSTQETIDHEEYLNKWSRWS
jgi:hypothetical protein